MHLLPRVYFHTSNWLLNSVASDWLLIACKNTCLLCSEYNDFFYIYVFEYENQDAFRNTGEKNLNLFLLHFL